MAALALVAACGGDPAPFRVDDDVAAAMRQVAASGRERGNRAGVFAKVGDSNTFEPGALVPIGCGRFRWRDGDERLRATADHFSVTAVEGAHPGCPANSFTRASRAAIPGWTAADLLIPTDEGCAPLDCELAAVRPAIAVVMIGTNDAADPAALRSFRRDLTEVVRRIVEAGVVPLLSTVPPRRGYDDEIDRVNETVEGVADVARVPVVDVHSRLRPGDLRDGLHPTDEGHERRNRAVLEALTELRTVIFGAEPPE